MLFELPWWTILVLARINRMVKHIIFKRKKVCSELLTQLCNRRTTTKGVPWEGKSGSGNGLVLSIQGCSKCMKVFNEDGSVGHTLDRLIWINTGKFIVVAPLHLPFGFYIPSYTAPHFILMPVLAKPVNNSNFLEMNLQCCASFHTFCDFPHYLK